MSAGTVVVLLLVLIAFDDRVRERFSRGVVTDPSGQLSGAERRLGDVTSVIVGAARDQSIQHAPLLIFALASAVLVLFMLRT